MYKAIKVRIYPNPQQSQKLAQVMGAARWWWNYALNLCNETYKATGKGLTQIALNQILPKLKMSEQTAWLKDCYSQVLQSTLVRVVGRTMIEMRMPAEILEQKGSEHFNCAQ